MKVSFFETARYQAPQPLPSEWPVPSGAYDPDAGARAYRGMIERLEFVEELGFDWVSVSEHHYSPRILTPSPIVSAAFLAAHLKKIKIALLGPIVPQSNPVRVAEELAMLDTMAPGTPGRRPAARDDQRVADLRPQPAGGARAHRRGHGADPQGVDGAAAVRLAGPPLPVPHGLDLAAPAAAAPSADLRARDQPRVLRVRRAPPPRLRRVLRLVRDHGQGHAATTASSARTTAGSRRPSRSSTGRTCSWPRPTRRPRRCCAGCRAGAVRHAARAFATRSMTLDSRNIAGEARLADRGRRLPTTFVGGPDTVVEQVRRCREVVGAGVLDLSLHPPGSGDLEPLMRALELFGTKVLPRIRDI